MASLKYQIQSIQNKSSHLPITHYPPPLILPQRRVQTLTQLAKPETQILDFCSPTTFGATSSHAYTIQFSRSVVSDSLRPHGLQYARLPCPSPTPGVYSNSCLLSQWCHQPSHPLLSPSPLAFNLSQRQGLFKWVSSLHQVAKDWSFSFSISPSNEYSELISFRMDGWISLQSKGLSRVFSNTTVQKHQFFGAQLSL